MRTLFIDCTNGVSGDMVLNALLEICTALNIQESQIESETAKLGLDCCNEYGHDHHEHWHGDHHEHSHGRSFREISEMITNSDLAPQAKHIAIAIYKAIAKAEAEVHGTDLATVHFHEVGRNRAIMNIVGTAVVLSKIAPDEVLVSPLHDGIGTIVCSHGEIPVPVPAVVAMKKQCDYEFIQEDVEMEMVTPSGLGTLIGIGAMRADADTAEKAKEKVIATGVGNGTRNTGRGGVKISLIEGQ